MKGGYGTDTLPTVRTAPIDLEPERVMEPLMVRHVMNGSDSVCRSMLRSEDDGSPSPPPRARIISGETRFVIWTVA